MTNCIGAPARQWLEQYVEGTLPEEEAQKFEDHYFDCPVCLGELQAIQAAQGAMRRHPISVTESKRVLAWPITWPSMVSFGALAAALIVGFVTFNHMSHIGQPSGNVAVTAPAPAPKTTPALPETKPVQPTVQIAELADLRLPSYNAPVLRGETENGAFENGMKQYVAGDCAAAEKTLSQVDANGPDGLAAQFYSGVCRMHSGDLSAAAATLRHVVGAGDSPYQESAFYYLAQIALDQSNAAEARRELNHVVSLRGDLEQQARRELEELPTNPAK